MSSFTCSPVAICTRHPTPIYVQLTGTGTAWTDPGTVFTISGVAGVSLDSYFNGSSTSFVLELHTTTGTSTGTLTIDDNAGATQTITVGVPSFVVSPAAVLPLNATTAIGLRGTNTVWSSESGGSSRPNFSISGVSGCTLDSAVAGADEDLDATLTITTGSSQGSLTITDDSTGRFTTILVAGAGSDNVATLTAQILAYFDIPGTEFFTLNDPVRGQLNSTYTLVEASAVDVTADGASVRVTRGRSSRITEDIPPGVMVATLRNEDRTYDPNFTSSAYFGNVVPGKRISAWLNGVRYFDGTVDDWNHSYDVSGLSTTEAIATDALGGLALAEFDAWTTTSQLPGARIAAVLSRNEVNFGLNRDLDTGVETLQADNVSWGSNVLNYLQLVARTDFGYLYASKDNTITYRDRDSLANSTPAVYLGSDVPFHGIEAQYGSETLYNRVGVDREGGTNQTVTDETSAQTYTRGQYRSLSITGLLLTSDARSLELANYLLNAYKTPKWRVSSVTVKLHALTETQLQQMIRLELGDVVNVYWTPNNTGDPIETLALVEGIDHEAGPQQHTMTLHLGDFDLRSFFTLNDPSLGVLDYGVLSF